MRWKESLNDLEKKLQGIVGDVLVSAACITYSGVGYRGKMVQEWLGFWNAKSIPISSEYTLITTMTEKTQVRFKTKMCNLL